MFLLTCLLYLQYCSSVINGGILYPYASENREVVSLDGIWNFQTDQHKPLLMPVPSSYNDITADHQLRDYHGWVEYQRNFFVPHGWKSRRVFLRFGSVQYKAEVIVNAQIVGEHTGGHLPFQFDVSDFLHYAGSNTIVVRVNNTLTRTTIPQDSIIFTNDTTRYPKGYRVYDHEYHYFNYAGIHRPVLIYTVPKEMHVEDINLDTQIIGKTGIIKYNISASNKLVTDLSCHVTLHDANDYPVAHSVGTVGQLIVDNVHLWWPRGSGQVPGYLYTLKVALMEDVYRLSTGFRSLHWNSTAFYLNNKPLYILGLGKHEDYDVIGRGLDLSVLVRDMNLFDWLGVNAFRTSHYPYSEEIMDFADKMGLLVIDEMPACTIKFFSPKLLKAHKKVVEELIARDKNRPSVIMWSLANEPYSDNNKSETYFHSLINLTKSLDSSRPVTFVTSRLPDTDKVVHLVDIICVNQYFGWYDDGGKTDLISYQLKLRIEEWHKVFNKSVLVTEYGAGSVPGIHEMAQAMWSEEYHSQLLGEHFKAFDYLKQSSYFLGEMIWNFADFATQEEIIRPGFCMKGLFSRQRQPKMSAYTTKSRYNSLS